MSFDNDKFQNMIRAQVMAVLSQFTHTRIGLVSSYNASSYTAKVLLQPEGTLTGSLPIGTPWLGNGWGFYSPPAINDMVLVHFMEGNLSVGFIGERLFNVVEKPVGGVPIGESWMVHKTGSYLKFKNDGTIEINAVNTSNQPTTINMTGNLIVNGTITATGDILDNTALANIFTMLMMRSTYDIHVHPGVQAGGSNTETTTQQMSP